MQVYCLYRPAIRTPQLHYPHHVRKVSCGAQLDSVGSAGDSSKVELMGREADNLPPSKPVRSASSERHRGSFIAAIKNHD